MSTDVLAYWKTLATDDRLGELDRIGAAIARRGRVEAFENVHRGLGGWGHRPTAADVGNAMNRLDKFGYLDQFRPVRVKRAA
jgi:hypothetical protein